MVDKGIDEKQALEFEKNYNHCLDKGKEIKQNNQFKFEDVFGAILNKNSISPEQIKKLNNFLGKILFTFVEK